jgi:hypothetical protein
MVTIFELAGMADVLTSTAVVAEVVVVGTAVPPTEVRRFFVTCLPFELVEDDEDELLDEDGLLLDPDVTFLRFFVGRSTTALVAAVPEEVLAAVSFSLEDESLEEESLDVEPLELDDLGFGAELFATSAFLGATVAVSTFASATLLRRLSLSSESESESESESDELDDPDDDDVSFFISFIWPTILD